MNFKFLLIAMFLFFGQTASAKKISFIVGIDEYSNLGVDRQLKRAVNDAKGVADIFNSRLELGYQGDVKLNLDRKEFRDEFLDFSEKIEEGDTVFFYFSGHAIEVEGENYLLPSDIPFVEYGRQKYQKSEAISLQYIINEISIRKPQTAILILDACRTDPFIPSEYATFTRGSMTAKGGLVKNQPPQGMFILYSAASRQVAVDRLPENDNSKYSVFTRHLIPLLKVPELTILEVATTLKRQVQQFTRDNWVNGYVQRPTYVNELANDEFCFDECSNSQISKDSLTAKVDLCENGSEQECSDLASFYLKGKGVEENIELALKYFEKACNYAEGGVYSGSPSCTDSRHVEQEIKFASALKGFNNCDANDDPYLMLYNTAQHCTSFDCSLETYNSLVDTSAYIAENCDIPYIYEAIGDTSLYKVRKGRLVLLKKTTNYSNFMEYMDSLEYVYRYGNG